MSRDRSTCEPLEPLIDPLKRRRPPTMVIGTAVGAAAAAGVTLIAGSFVVRDNNQKLTEVSAAALALAENRNACHIKAQMTTELGKPAVSLTVDIATKTKPDSMNKQYDEPGINVSFRDDGKSALNGILILRETPGGEPGSGLLDSNSEAGPDTGTSSMTLTEPELAKGRATYEVYRQNTIETTITGPRITDRLHETLGLVSCGEFVYDNSSPTPILVTKSA